MSQSDYLSGDVDSAAGKTKSVRFGEINQEKMKAELSRREVLHQAIANLGKVVRKGIVMNHQDFVRETLGHDVSKIALLLLREDVQIRGNRL
jgi:hypothetical protein